MSNKKKTSENKTSNHKWNIFTDKCDRCGLQRKFITHSTYTMIMKYKGYEYLVNGKWQSERPDCISFEKKDNTTKCMMCGEPKQKDVHTCCEECGGLSF